MKCPTVYAVEICVAVVIVAVSSRSSNSNNDSIAIADDVYSIFILTRIILTYSLLCSTLAFHFIFVEWSSWSECLKYDEVAPNTRARYRQTQKNNKCITESLAQCCIPHRGRQQQCRASRNKCARFPGFIFDSAYGK